MSGKEKEIEEKQEQRKEILWESRKEFEAEKEQSDKTDDKKNVNN